MDNKFGTDKILQNIQQLKNTLPVELANQAQNFFMASWKKQGFDDGGVQSWPVPKRRIEGTEEYKYPKSKGLGRRTRATLVQSGALRRAVGMSIRSTTFEKVQLIVGDMQPSGSGVKGKFDYARYQNEGTDKIPKRKFMGDSATLRQMQIKKISSSIDKVWLV